MTSRTDPNAITRHPDERNRRRRWIVEEARLREQLADEAALGRRRMAWSAFVLILVATIAVSTYAMARLW